MEKFPEKIFCKIPTILHVFIARRKGNKEESLSKTGKTEKSGKRERRAAHQMLTTAFSWEPSHGGKLHSR
jgi:hypothetical protein